MRKNMSGRFEYVDISILYFHFVSLFVVFFRISYINSNKMFLMDSITQTIHAVASGL